MSPAIGIQLSPNGASVAHMLAAAAEYDAAGVESIWVGDHLIDYFEYREVATEAFVVLGAIAAVTSRAHIGVMVASALFRHPALLAQAAGTVADASGGRFELGVGAGGVRDEHQVLGFDWPRRASRFGRLRDTLAAVRALQQPGRIHFASDTVTFAGAVGHPHLPSVRLVVSALAPGTARLAGTLGDEVLTNDYADLDAAGLLRSARDAADAAGRTITASLLVPDRETTVAGGRHRSAGAARAEALGVDRVVWRLLPPYPDPDVVLRGAA